MVLLVLGPYGRRERALPGPHPLPYFVVKNYLLYCVSSGGGRKNVFW